MSILNPAVEQTRSRNPALSGHPSYAPANGANNRRIYSLGGMALTSLAVARMGFKGISAGRVLAAAAGGALAYRGVTGEWPLVKSADPDIRVEAAVTINRPVGELYRFWRDLENLPRVMSHLESVTAGADGRSHWVAKAPLGRTIEWDAQIINEQENRLIAWQSIGDAIVYNAGAVRFSDLPGRGTEVHVELEYRPPAGRVGAMVARAFLQEPNQQIRADLRRFKQLIETGEVPTTKGQPHGPLVPTKNGSAA